MAKHITIQVPGKHPQTGELTTFDLKGQRIDIDIGGHAVPFLIHGRGIGTALTHIPSGYRIALLGGWLTARNLATKEKPSRTTCARLAIDRLVANYGSLHLLDRLNVNRSSIYRSALFATPLHLTQTKQGNSLTQKEDHDDRHTTHR